MRPTRKPRNGRRNGARRGPSRKLGPTGLPFSPGICPNGVAASSGMSRRSTPMWLALLVESGPGPDQLELGLFDTHET